MPIVEARILKELIEKVGKMYSYDRIGVVSVFPRMVQYYGHEDNDELFLYIASQLSQYELAYLHSMDGLGFVYHNESKALTLHEIK